jgi:3-phosphoshikimate 1-carboxyvinyltransferase
MGKIKIEPSKLKGSINIPASKSLSHRAIICGALCNFGETIIDNVVLSEDIKATIDGMKKFGAEIEVSEVNNKSRLHIKRSQVNISETVIDCRESGSTLRFLIPLSLVLSDRCTFTGSDSLAERPLNVYYDIFRKKNISFQNENGNLPLTVCGKLSSGTYEVTGKISSQFISGLLFALPMLDMDSSVKIIDELESKDYVALTIDVLEKFNVHVENKNYREFFIHGNSLYKPVYYSVEGDYSQGAFYIAAKEIGNDVECMGLNKNSLQGDKEIVNIIKEYKGTDNELIIDVSQIPDLVPTLAVLASLKEGKRTKIINAGRLRIKESDRLKAISSEMNKLGADIEETCGGLTINGKKDLMGAVEVQSWNDHRIAMALAVAATRCKESIILNGHNAVDKSYPGFWDDYASLGGKIKELE